MNDYSVKFVTVKKNSLYTPVAQYFVTDCPFHADSQIRVTDTLRRVEVQVNCTCRVVARYTDKAKDSILLMVERV